MGPLVKVAQLYSILCDPMDSSLPGSSIPGILQARSGQPFPSPGDLPNPGIEPRSPTLQAILYQLSYQVYEDNAMRKKFITFPGKPPLPVSVFTHCPLPGNVIITLPGGGDALLV